MESELTPGKQVWVKMPYGNFFIDSKSPVVLIAGGTGITAFASFLENCKESSENKILVFYGAKERSLLLYRDFLNESKKNKNMQTYYFIENDEKYLEDEIPGQLSVEEIFKRIEAPSLQKYYLSGPPLMLKYLTNGLQEKGISLESINIDAWG